MITAGKSFTANRILPSGEKLNKHGLNNILKVEQLGRNSWEGLEHYPKSWLKHCSKETIWKRISFTVECYEDMMNGVYVDFLLVTTSL